MAKIFGQLEIAQAENLATDPTLLPDGRYWYDNVNGKLKYRDNTGTPASRNILTEDKTQTVTNKTISGASNTFSNIPANTAMTGALPLANGGTNNASLTAPAGGVLYTDGTKVANVAAGTTGQVLTSNGAGTPTWNNPASAVTGSYSQAYFSSASSWSTTSTTYADGANAGGNALTVRASSGITLTAAAGGLCGITFTPASTTAVYLITAGLWTYNTSSNVTIRMFDGTTTINNIGGSGGTSGAVTPNNISGIYVPGTASAVTVKIQMLTNTGTANILAAFSGNSVEWTVVRLF